MRPPIDGMKSRPFGEDYMAGAWLGCVLWAGTEPAMLRRFAEATGHDLVAVLDARGFDAAMATELDTMIAFADWVTVNVWGIEGDDPAMAGAGT